MPHPARVLVGLPIPEPGAASGENAPGRVARPGGSVLRRSPMSGLRDGSTIGMWRGCVIPA